MNDNLRRRLRLAVEKEPAEALLFSGGLDSSVLACLSTDIKLITVTLDLYGKDLVYAMKLADYLGLDLYHKKIHVEEAIGAIPTVIEILGSFDPAIPNDITVYFGLRFARELGITSVMTGDGSDELLGGYDYMQKIDKLDEYIGKITHGMYFSSNDIGSSLGIKIIQPYLDKDFVDLCLGIGASLKIREEKGKVWGKWILRKAFSDDLPEDIIWQDKRPLEYGSGTNELRRIISEKILDTEFEEKKRLYPIKFINKEHLYFYEIYKEVIGEIPEPRQGDEKCPGCGTGIKKGACHCRICGWTKEKNGVRSIFL
jgi:asparagine synthase (glutamine-hydrolysing)